MQDSMVRAAQLKEAFLDLPLLPSPGSDGPFGEALLMLGKVIRRWE